MINLILMQTVSQEIIAQRLVSIEKHDRSSSFVQAPTSGWLHQIFVANFKSKLSFCARHITMQWADVTSTEAEVQIKQSSMFYDESDALELFVCESCGGLAGSVKCLPNLDRILPTLSLTPDATSVVHVYSCWRWNLSSTLRHFHNPTRPHATRNYLHWNLTQANEFFFSTHT